jgi:hypothetical protein
MKYCGLIALSAFLLLATSVFAASKGTVPRTTANSYPAHGKNGNSSIGAKLLSREEARKTFVSDVNRCCVVVEVAIYPDNAAPAQVSLDQFVLKVKGTDTTKKPSSAKVVATALQKGAAGDHDIAIYPETGVGYSSGDVYDPATGRRRSGGVYTHTGVGVAIGSGSPASTEKDREVMETELSDKGLPEGESARPVAGYVYFPMMQGKKKATYQVEYELSGNKILLEFPSQ